MGALRSILESMGVPMKPVGTGPDGQPAFAPPMRLAGILPQPAQTPLHGMGVDWPFVSKEKLGGGDIFVGGGGDDVRLPGRGYGAMHDYAGSYAQDTNRPTKYLPNNRPGQLMEAIRQANRTDGPVNLVGHSWGANDVYKAAVEARRQGLRVDNVVTLDPVGRFAPTDHAPDHWTNIEALSPGGTSGDIAAAIGGKPSELPVQDAEKQLQTRTHHDFADELMSAGGREVLDASRAIPIQSPWRDELSTADWMQWRGSSPGRNLRQEP